MNSEIFMYFKLCMIPRMLFQALHAVHLDFMIMHVLSNQLKRKYVTVFMTEKKKSLQYWPNPLSFISYVSWFEEWPLIISKTNFISVIFQSPGFCDFGKKDPEHNLHIPMIWISSSFKTENSYVKCWWGLTNVMVKKFYGLLNFHMPHEKRDNMF